MRKVSLQESRRFCGSWSISEQVARVAGGANEGVSNLVICRARHRVDAYLILMEITIITEVNQ